MSFLLVPRSLPGCICIIFKSSHKSMFPPFQNTHFCITIVASVLDHKNTSICVFQNRVRGWRLLPLPLVSLRVMFLLFFSRTFSLSFSLSWVFIDDLRIGAKSELEKCQLNACENLARQTWCTTNFNRHSIHRPPDYRSPIHMLHPRSPGCDTVRSFWGLRW